MGLGSSKPSLQATTTATAAAAPSNGAAVLAEQNKNFAPGGVFSSTGGARKTRTQRKKVRKTLKSRKN